MLIADWRLPGKPTPRQRPVVLPNGDDATNPDGSAKTLEIPYAGDSGILLRGSARRRSTSPATPSARASCMATGWTRRCPPKSAPARSPRSRPTRNPAQWNRFVITLKKDRVTVVLNGQTVIDHVPLPGIPARGPIGLQHHGDPVQFTNLFIKELE